MEHLTSHKQAFEENGFTVINGVYSDSEVETLLTL